MIWLLLFIVLFLVGTFVGTYRLMQKHSRREEQVDPSKLRRWQDDDEDED